jgi:phenylacetyl-CoA:acceptor oxidoreductase 26-kDa subunit
LLFAGLVLARWVLWRAWRRRLDATADRRALAALDAAGRGVQWLGGALPLVLALLALGGAPAASVLLAAAGLCAAGAGAFFKFTLITRAAYNQGFALQRLPVRGVAR